MQFSKKIAVWLGVMLILVAGMVFLPEFAYAQSNVADGLSVVGQETQLGAEDPRVLVARIIRVFLGFLGVVALAIVLYGGFLYMMSGGSDEAVAKAKKVLINGVIGLAIILTSFAITSFIISSLTEATGFSGTGGDVSGGGGGLSGGGGAVTGFKATLSPKGDDQPVNSVAMVIFPDGETPNASNDYQNAKDGLKVFKVTTDNDGVETETAVSGNVSVDGGTIVFTPEGNCPAGCNAAGCFESESDFRVKAFELLSQDNDRLSCSNQLKGFCDSVDFTTSDICDSEDPTADITGPVLPVKFGDTVTFQMIGTDNIGVARTSFCGDIDPFDRSCGQLGPYAYTKPKSYPVSWGQSSSNHDLGWNTSRLRVYDTSNNSAEDQLKWLNASEACFTDTDQFDCTLPDCEIACDVSCGDDPDCSMVCTQNEAGETACTPWEYPLIKNVVPATGAPGSFVTVQGSQFGALGPSSSVTFNGIKAGLACGTDGSWSETSVVVQVPETATTGPIRLTRTDGHYYDTGDENVPSWQGDFVVDESVPWVGLCSVLKQEPSVNEGKWKAVGDIGEEVAAFGNRFGTAQDTGDEVLFNGIASSSIGAWTDDKISSIRIPNIQGTSIDIQVQNGETVSNPVPFTIAASGPKMTISAVNPNPAPAGQYVTVSGTGFGIGGAVTFINKGTKEEFIADIGCANGWSDAQITVQVPTQAPAGNYSMLVSVGSQKAEADFVINAEPVQPGICEISPDNGPFGTLITIVGSGFGTTSGEVVFHDGVAVQSGALDLSNAVWTDETITNVQVPLGTTTGNIVVRSGDGIDSNGVLFSTGSCSPTSCSGGEVCCGGASCVAASACEAVAYGGEYSWFFSTGQIPKVPRVLERTCVKNGHQQSPAPAKNVVDTCPNQTISFTFNMEMNPNTFANAVEIRKCKNPGEQCNLDACNAENCEGKGVYYSFDDNDVEVESEDGENVTFVLLSNISLQPNYWYKVIVNEGVEAMPDLSGAPAAALLNPYSWKFKTGTEACSLDNVVVSPSEGVIDNLFGDLDYIATGQGEQCEILMGDQFPWTWSVEKYAEKLVRLDSENDGRPDIATFGVNQSVVGPETAPDDPAIVQAATTVNEVSFSDDANVHIDFRDPAVIEYWPNCGEACINVQLGALFNTYIKKATIEAPGAVQLYQCQNDECLSGLTPIGLLSEGPGVPAEVTCVNTAGVTISDESVCTEIQINFQSGHELQAGSYYRVVLSSDIMSASGVGLTGLNYSTTASESFCGNGVIEVGEDCEAVCKNDAGVICAAGDLSCTDCAVAYNPFCSDSCTLKPLSICDGTSATNCCGNGVIETVSDQGVSQKEECEASCTKSVAQSFVGDTITSPLEACNVFIADPANEIGSNSCSCSTPETCGEENQYCSFVCLEDPTTTCTADSFDCTCVAPQVCVQDPSRVCTADELPCTCTPEKACSDDVTTSCTSAAQCNLGATCREVGSYQFDASIKCFDDSEDQSLGACQKQNVCAEDIDNQFAPEDVRVCTEDSAGCACRPLETVDGATCGEAGLNTVCAETCTVDATVACSYGEEDCSCAFDQSCSSCVSQVTTVAEESSLFDAFSWVFKTRDDGGICTVNSVDVRPASYTTNTKGDIVEYSAAPFGAPDECSARGQRLNPFSYDWDWTGKPAAQVFTASSLATDLESDYLVSMYTPQFSLNASSGCANDCTRTGSVVYAPECGNGIIEIGEECDDGNVTPGDGCSVICLNEGTPSCFGGDTGICCGDGEKDPGEECDDGDLINGDGCSNTCLNEGSIASGFTCGNGVVDFGEDNDFGNSTVNQQLGLNNRCLNVGSTYQENQNVSICGNQIIEPGEECEASSCFIAGTSDACTFGEKNCVCTFDSDPYCTDRCQLKGFPSCSGDADGSLCCGNGIIDEVYDTRTLADGSSLQITEECDAVCERTVDGAVESCTYGEDGCVCTLPPSCSANCLNNGSNFTYDSFCSNGVLEAGEDAVCEAANGGQSLAGLQGAPTMFATVIGWLDQVTSGIISFNAREKDTNKSGDADLTYSYNGVGEAPEFCKDFPVVKRIAPDPSIEACQNAAFTFTFDRPVDSLAGEFGPANVDFEYQVDGQCGVVALSPVAGVVDTFVLWLKKGVNYFLGAEVVAAQQWCPVGNFNAELLSTEEGVASIAQISLTDAAGNNIPLSKKTKYRIRFKNLANECNIPFTSPDFTEFTSSDNFCHLDYISVLPAYKLATFTGEQWDYTYEAKSGGVTLDSIPGIYDWEWSDLVSNDERIATVNNGANPPIATAGTMIGSTQAVVDATITTDEIFSESIPGAERVVTGFGTIETFLCENPWVWPDVSPDPDFSEFNDEKFNARLMYCRDSGAINNMSDDLPFLVPVGAGTGGANCNDGIDNDGDGGIDYAVTGPYTIFVANRAIDTQSNIIAVTIPPIAPIALLVDAENNNGSYTLRLSIGQTVRTAGNQQVITPGQGYTYDYNNGVNDYEVRIKYHNQSVDGRYANITIDWRQSYATDADCTSSSGSESPITTALTEDLATYFFFRGEDADFPSTHDQSDDAISLRVMANPLNLSAREWYLENAPNPSDNVKDVSIACDFDPIFNVNTCYQGVQDGNTFYVSGGNISGTVLYNNMYIIGVNDAANTNTMNIMGQFIKYMRLNTDLLTEEPAAYQVVKRDVNRINDVTTIQRVLNRFYAGNGTYPTLTGGTYVKNVSMSSWPSWQAVLGNAVGMALPQDPINTFEQYPASAGSSCVSPDAASCQCPTECNDGVDNDGDGLTDFGADPECSNGRAMSESDNQALNLTLQCFNGDQCFSSDKQYICSICAPGADPSTCYNSTTLGVGYSGSEFKNSYIYSYTYAGTASAEIEYQLEGLSTYYSSVNNQPSTLIHP